MNALATRLLGPGLLVTLLGALGCRAPASSPVEEPQAPAPVVLPEPAPTPEPAPEAPVVELAPTFLVGSSGDFAEVVAEGIEDRLIAQGYRLSKSARADFVVEVGTTSERLPGGQAGISAWTFELSIDVRRKGAEDLGLPELRRKRFGPEDPLYGTDPLLQEAKGLEPYSGAAIEFALEACTLTPNS